MCTVHCTLYTVQFTMYTVNYTLYSPLCKITPTPCPRGNPSCKDTLPNYIAAGGHERSLENPQLQQPTRGSLAKLEVSCRPGQSQGLLYKPRCEKVIW